MTKFFPKVFITGIVLFLLLGAGYGITQAARAIPWDCSDWQAFAHEDRTTVILESLAENRGKTLYCGVDQSDTFTKAETWEAGKDRNERDDTIYSGERGIFRGFIAAQEGWLTEGESGVTGVSIDRIFEFPREERRRTKRVKRFAIANDGEQWPTNALASCGQVGGLICSGWGGWSTRHNLAAAAQNRGRGELIGAGFNTNQLVDWQTNTKWNTDAQGQRMSQRSDTVSPNTAWWQAQAVAAATAACRERGARYATGSAAFLAGHNGNNGSGANFIGDGLGLLYEQEAGYFNYRFRQSRTWSATCKKVIRRTRK